MPTERSFVLLGVPTSAAAHGPGQEKAPAAFRAAGISESLNAAGLTWHDLGDLSVNQWKSAREPYGAGFVNNLPAVLQIAIDVRDRLIPQFATGHIPVVLGGDCT